MKSAAFDACPIRQRPGRSAILTLLLGLLAMPALTSPVAPVKEKAIQGAGVEVTVTPEMAGAGAVSSGVIPVLSPTVPNADTASKATASQRWRVSAAG